MEPTDIAQAAETLASAQSFQQSLFTRIRRLQDRRSLRESLGRRPEKYYSYAQHPQQCRQCGEQPIVGMRLQCDTCKDYSVCERCVREVKHEHKTWIEVPFEGTHENIACDGCGQLPLENIRYNCAICGNFDLCHPCQRTMEHPHSSWKIITPIHLIMDIFQAKAIYAPGEMATLTLLIRNHSQMSFNCIAFIVESGKLPFHCHKEFDFPLSPGESARALLTGKVDGAPGPYSATLQVLLPEYNEVVQGEWTVNFSIKGSGVFQKLKSYFG